MEEIVRTVVKFSIVLSSFMVNTKIFDTNILSYIIDITPDLFILSTFVVKKYIPKSVILTGSFFVQKYSRLV
nr:MAG TPA: hypothetical protein [Caudoviricetes sp.]